MIDAPASQHRPTKFAKNKHRLCLQTPVLPGSPWDSTAYSSFGDLPSRFPPLAQNVLPLYELIELFILLTGPAGFLPTHSPMIYTRNIP
ncbi:hypothetical protein AG1IA_04955 [Rhizoctonia solani AG-1 IA]|uniref:Uncharacterized protein n=1 Tax=Thanatephorus cucumeris (strain AG1-IA) TaxID=983506 RepID=L8WSA8_THACA|nr:hypothetical protein AG1IA_04955 [Rhizoctonia solani AG-1 IA]